MQQATTALPAQGAVAARPGPGGGPGGSRRGAGTARGWTYDRGVSEAIAFAPFEPFLADEQASEQRHELVGGRVHAEAGGPERHDLAAGLAYELLAPGARSSGCRPFTANRLLRTARGNSHYPDVLVACGPAPHRLFETNASVIVEVLSPSTADVDRRERAVAYAESATLTQLLPVHRDTRCIEVARPAGGSIESWQAYGPGDIVRTADGDIDIDELYDVIDRTANTTELTTVQRYAWLSEVDLMARPAGLALERWRGGWGQEAFTDASAKHVSGYQHA